jgi:hypothetical protein
MIVQNLGCDSEKCHLGLYTLKQVGGIIIRVHLLHNKGGVKNLGMVHLSNLGITMVFILGLYSKYTGFS